MIHMKSPPKLELNSILICCFTELGLCNWFSQVTTSKKGTVVSSTGVQKQKAATSHTFTLLKSMSFLYLYTYYA